MKKTVSLFLVLLTSIFMIVTFSLAGCKDTAESTEESEEATEETTTTEEEEATEEVVEEATGECVPGVVPPEMPDEYVNAPLYVIEDYLEEFPIVDCYPEEEIRIIALSLENNPYWIEVAEGFALAKEKLAEHNCTLDYVVPGDSHLADVFGPAIETAITQEYDGLCAVVGEAGTVPYFNKATEAGIITVQFNCGLSLNPDRFAFCGPVMYEQGVDLAHKMAELLGEEGGQVAIITGYFSVDGHEERRLGFEDTIAAEYPNIEIVGSEENHDSGDEAYTLAKDFMTAYPDLKGIYVTAGGPFGAAAAVEDSGKAEDITVISFDAPEETLNFVRKGVIDCTYVGNQGTQGWVPPVIIFNYLAAGQYPPARDMTERYKMVTPENVAEYFPE